MPHDALLEKAAEAVATAEALFVGAGAGMGVDSGLPDFRGNQGFWRAYPPYQKLGLSFVSLANPRWFASDPALAWGFYGHRLNLYRATAPHNGFRILRSWAGRLRHGAFVFTSNVDGHFQRAGFDPDRVVEIHGSVHRLQCTADCGAGLFDAGAREIALDESTMRAAEPFPRCPSCGSLARPNILMFNDWDWDDRVTAAHLRRMTAWLDAAAGSRLVVVECGAGTAIPTVRQTCEGVALRLNAPLVRINPREPSVPAGQIGLPLGALEGLQQIDRLCRR